MNLVFGSAAAGNFDPFSRLNSAAASLYGEDAREPDGGSDVGTVRLAAISDGGVVVGRAADDEVALVLIGGLHHPLPNWEAGRPPDDPDRTAAWILRRYRERGESFLDGAQGQFAVLVRDHGGRRLRAACDPGGLRTLFVHEGQGATAIASNLFLLGRALRDRLEPDRSLEDFLLVYGFLPWGRTVFKGVRILPPGVLHTWQDGNLDTRPLDSPAAWADRFPAMDPNEASEDEVLDRLYEAFMTATEEQAGSAPVAGVLLGGVDSALVASALHRLGKKVETFSFHYEESGFDQPHTDTVSRFLGSRHHWVSITPEVMREGLERFGLIFSRPTNWPNYVIQTARVCEVMRERGILHVHSGDGCDQTFLGYPRTHTMARLYQAAPRLPPALAHSLIRLVARPSVERALGRPYRVGMNILRNLSRTTPQRGFINFRVFDESSLPRLRQGESPRQERSIEEILVELTRGLEDLSPDRLAYRGKAGVGTNKSKLGGSSDHTGVIVYAPYLHPGLKQFSSALPERLLRPGDDPETAVTGKYVLLKMAERKQLLPREVIYQKKLSAVDAPADTWYAGPLRESLMAELEHLPFEANRQYLERLVEPTVASTLYARHLSSDHLTTHEASLLATYGALLRALA